MPLAAVLFKDGLSAIAISSVISGLVLVENASHQYPFSLIQTMTTSRAANEQAQLCLDCGSHYDFCFL